MKASDKNRTSHSPRLSSFFRFHRIRPPPHRDEGSKLGRQTQHQHARKEIPNKHRAAKGLDHDRDAGCRSNCVSIILQDADRRHGPFYLSVKRGSEVLKLESWVIQRCQTSGGSAPNAVRVRFFAEGRELGQHDLVGSHPSVWFRLAAAGDSNTWKLTDVNNSDKALDTGLAKQLIVCIEAGKTVGQVRKLVATHLGIDDPDRVIIKMRDGARPGPLPGDMWELRQVRHWFSRWLSIGVGRSGSHLALEGPWGKYVFHPSDTSCRRDFVLGRDVKKLIESRLLTSADRLHDDNLGQKGSPITLLYRGNRLDDYSVVRFRTGVRFELPWYLEDALASEESWAMPATDTCAVCTDNKKPTEVPARITSSCRHKGTTCKNCLGHWIHSSLETSTWDRLRCPECPEPLKFENVKRYATRPDFDRYDDLATRASLESISNFRWCLSTSCKSGQIHDPTCTRFKCTVCKARHCVYHNVPWHSGETCDEYDRKNRRRQKADKASEELIKKITRTCPGCKQAVHKWSGCNHITCVCGHEWCYICLAPFRRNRHDFLYCRHNAGCSETDPFADLIELEGNPGVPEFIRGMRNGVAILTALPPPFAENRRHEQAPDDLGAWLDRVNEEFLLAAVPALDFRGDDNVPRRQARGPRLNELLEEEMNRARVLPVNTGTIGRNAHHRPAQDRVNAWARAWMRWEDDGAGVEAMVVDMARNRNMPLPFQPAPHVERGRERAGSTIRDVEHQATFERR